MADLSTILISIAAIAMYLAKVLEVDSVIKLINQTRGNSYLRMNMAMDLTEW